MPLITADQMYASKYEVLVYGEPGVGKTYTFHDIPKVMYLVVDDNGATVLQDVPNADKIKVFWTRSWSDLGKFVLSMSANPDVKDVETFVVDTVSEGQTLERLRQVGDLPLTQDNWDMNQFIYAKNNAQLMSLARILKKMKKNVIWLCHQTEEVIGSDPKTKKILIRPNLSPTLLASIQANIDAQIYYRREGGNRVMVFSGDGRFQTKNRLKGPKEIINPNWSKLKPVFTSRMKPEAGA